MTAPASLANQICRERQGPGRGGPVAPGGGQIGRPGMPVCRPRGCAGAEKSLRRRNRRSHARMTDPAVGHITRAAVVADHVIFYMAGLRAVQAGRFMPRCSMRGERSQQTPKPSSAALRRTEEAPVAQPLPRCHLTTCRRRGQGHRAPPDRLAAGPRRDPCPTRSAVARPAPPGSL